MTGASTAPELDGALAKADGIAMRMPFQSDPDARNRINEGKMDYIDIHLSHVAQHVWFGFYGEIDTAVIEVSAIREDGLAGALHLGRQQQDLAGPGQEGDRRGQRMAAGRRRRHARHLLRHRAAAAPQADSAGERQRPHRRHRAALRPDKIVAVVRTNGPDRNSPFSPIDATSEQIAAHLIEFLKHEVKKGRLPPNLLPLQSGVGNIPNAVLAGLAKSGFAT
jgi:succinyl-CoA:acetate CoA-transferase